MARPAFGLDGAGPVPEILHRALNALAWLVRLGVVPSLAGCAKFFYEAINRLRWGEHRGGMFVAVRGETPAGKPIERAWHLLAEGDDWPFIPSMAAAAVVRRCLEGRPPAEGARPAATDLDLDDYAPIFAGRAICTGLRETRPDTAAMPLYRRVLGAAWHDLPEPVRAMHDFTNRRTAEGIGTVERGRGLLARLVAEIFGFPRSGRNVPVTVAFERRESAERWRRTFAGRSFASLHGEGRGRFDRLIVERFGPFAFGLALVLAQGKMRLVLRRWSFLGLPLPPALAPAGDSYEFARAGRFHFYVELRHRLTGPIVRYRGWLEPRR